MPSLPVDNQSISSNEDAYRRYFGALKKSSPAKPRKLLCYTMLKIVGWSMFGSIPTISLAWLYYQPYYFNEDTRFGAYLLYPFFKFLITFIWCLSIIFVIFKHKYSNIKIMRAVAFFVSLFGWATSTILSYFFYSPHHIITIDQIYFYALHFPLTLYFSVVTMYFSQYQCCPILCTQMMRRNKKISILNPAINDSDDNESSLTAKLIIPIPNASDPEPEILEDVASKTTGSVYQDDRELSLSFGSKNEEDTYEPSKKSYREDSGASIEIFLFLFII